MTLYDTCPTWTATCCAACQAIKHRLPTFRPVVSAYLSRCVVFLWVFCSGPVFVRSPPSTMVRVSSITYASSAMVELMSAIVFLHASMVGTWFLLFLWFSTCNCCSFWTTGGLGFPWWLFNSRYLLFREEPIPISASSRSKIAFTGNCRFLFGFFVFFS